MIEMKLIHDGCAWKAINQHFSARGRTLIELDRDVVKHLKSSRLYRNQRHVDVRMCFDNALIPQWIRQYSGHYFNRLVTFELS